MLGNVKINVRDLGLAKVLAFLHVSRHFKATHLHLKSGHRIEPNPFIATALIRAAVVFFLWTRSTFSVNRILADPSEAVPCPAQSNTSTHTRLLKVVWEKDETIALSTADPPELSAIFHLVTRFTVFEGNPHVYESQINPSNPHQCPNTHINSKANKWIHESAQQIASINSTWFRFITKSVQLVVCKSLTCFHFTA